MKQHLLMNWIFSAAILLTPISLRADMAAKPTMLNREERSTQIELIATYLAQEEVLLQMEAMGVSPVLAAERATSLTEAQLQRPGTDVQDAPAAGAPGVVVAVLVIILLLEIVGISNISRRV